MDLAWVQPLATDVAMYEETRMQSRTPAVGTLVQMRVLLPLLSMSLIGCLPGWVTSKTPLARSQPCVLPVNVDKQQLVAHLNQNRDRLRSWRSTDVSIQAAGAGPMRLGASLAVERPRHFRLIAQSLRGVEADLGSNADRFWYWMRADETPYIFTAAHDDGDLVRQQLEIPFQPEWLMEALGVVRLQAEDFELQRHGLGDQRVSLVSTRASSSGAPMYREMIVDTCRGWVVEHGLYDADRQPLARAVLSDYAVHDGVTMPHRVELTFPRNGQALILRIGDVEVNPEQVPSAMWEFPSIPDHRPLDIGQQIRRMQRHRGTLPTSPPSFSPPSFSGASSGTGHSAADAADADEWWETPAIDVPVASQQFNEATPASSVPLRMVSQPREPVPVAAGQTTADSPWASEPGRPSSEPWPAQSNPVQRVPTVAGSDQEEPQWAEPDVLDD